MKQLQGIKCTMVSDEDKFKLVTDNGIMISHRFPFPIV